jgi:hypothetical protein
MDAPPYPPSHRFCAAGMRAAAAEHARNAAGYLEEGFSGAGHRAQGIPTMNRMVSDGMQPHMGNFSLESLQPFRGGVACSLRGSAGDDAGRMSG